MALSVTINLGTAWAAVSKPMPQVSHAFSQHLTEAAGEIGTAVQFGNRSQLKDIAKDLQTVRSNQPMTREIRDLVSSAEDHLTRGLDELNRATTEIGDTSWTREWATEYGRRAQSDLKSAARSVVRNAGALDAEVSNEISTRWKIRVGVGAVAAGATGLAIGKASN